MDGGAWWAAVREVAKSWTRLSDFTTPWTAAYQDPPSMGFSRQEYWSGVPLPSPDNGATNIINIYDCIVYLPYPMEPPVSLKYKFIIICSI